MPPKLKGLIKFPTARLSRRIVFWVFFSVLVIEAIILVPSSRNRQRELLNVLKEISTAKVSLIMKMTPLDVNEQQLFAQLSYLQNYRAVVGGRFYNPSGREIGVFGESPDSTFDEVRRGGMSGRMTRDRTRYDVGCTASRPDGDYLLVLRHDATPVKMEVKAFVLRIAGLVLIISLFVTAGAWIALGPIVVTPILRLRNDLIEAGDAVVNDAQAPAFYSATVRREDELGEVIKAFNRMFGQITNAIAERKHAEAELEKSLQQVEDYSRALDAELQRGREMQKNFLPAALWQQPGWETAAYFKPARQVAGDFYDVFELPGGRVGLVLADVCDKGVGAALFMALFRSLIRIFSGRISLEDLECPLPDPAGTPPEQGSLDVQVDEFQHKALRAVRYTNNYIAHNHGDLAMFATLFFGVLNPSNGTLSYINGGHDPVYVSGPDGGVKALLGPSGPAVGVNPEAEFRIREIDIAPGDILLGITDGVLEAQDAGGEFFSTDRLQQLLASPASSAAEMIARIQTRLLDHVGEAEQFDDITILTLRRER